VKAILHSLAGTALDLPPIRTLLRHRNRGLGIVFMLHRFRTRDSETGPGHRAVHLRNFLEYIRARGFPVLPVDELLRGMRTGEIERGPSLAFTLDDGYHDQAEVAAPIFAEFGFPATIYPVVDFLDGRIWLWWDRLEYVLRETDRPRAQVDLGSRGAFEFALGAQDERRRAVTDLTQRMKELGAAERDDVIECLAEACGVDIPSKPPSRYAPMSWDQARDLEPRGITFGAHTLSHPILSRECAEVSAREIAGSWERIQREVTRPMPVFCYSNGRPIDFGEREIRTVRELGLEAALAADAGYVHAKGTRRYATLTRLAEPGETELDLFRIPRYSLPAIRPTRVRMVSGLAGGREVALSPL